MTTTAHPIATAVRGPRLVAAALVAAAALAGCAMPGAMPESQRASTTLLDPTGRTVGTATFADTASGFSVTVDARGLTPGLHGFHVHQNGQCAPGPDAATGQMVAFGAAGGHFDPRQTMTHGNPDGASDKVHAGELPNLDVGPDGAVKATFINPRGTVKPGATSVVGRSLVIHANKDDYMTNPAGNSGPRVACGVITASAR